MEHIGKALQVVGLVVPPVAMVLQITGGLSRSFNVSDLVWALVFSVTAFFLGRMVEGYAAKAK